MPMDKKGWNCILVIMDRLGKRSISIPCKDTCDSKELAWLFVDRWVRWAGSPDTIVSDRGPQFVSSLWKEFQRIVGVKVSLSTADHPETDGQTEIMNQYIDQRLRPFVNYYQDNWSDLLPLIDIAQLILPHTSIGMSPFQLYNGFEPRMSWDYEPPKSPSTARESLNQKEAQKIARRMESGINLARQIMQGAQAKMQR